MGVLWKISFLKLNKWWIAGWVEITHSLMIIHFFRFFCLHRCCFVASCPSDCLTGRIVSNGHRTSKYGPACVWHIGSNEMYKYLHDEISKLSMFTCQRNHQSNFLCFHSKMKSVWSEPRNPFTKKNAQNGKVFISGDLNEPQWIVFLTPWKKNLYVFPP